MEFSTQCAVKDESDAININTLSPSLTVPRDFCTAQLLYKLQPITRNTIRLKTKYVVWKFARKSVMLYLVQNQ